MANLPNVATNGTPVTDHSFITGNATGNINVGDYLIYSGHHVIPTAMGTVGQVKASGVGIALEANPVYDSFGVTRQNTALLIGTQGVYRVSAYHNVTASAEITLGTPLYPATTGSGVAAPTGQTGVAAQWGTAVKVANSANAIGSGVVTVIGLHSLGAASGATQLDVMLTPARPDVY